ncbi:MAG: hypothetical protein WCX28_09235 [Bacteriovoracaceae bacterium]|nr:hypothetical protein [Bacteroidota bacterium]
MKILRIVSAMFATTTALFGQNLSNIPASFVDIGFGARPAALGGAYVALSNDVNSVLWNPAGMASMKKSQASFSYTNQLGLFAYKSFAAVVPFTGNAVGIAVVSSGDQALQELTVQASYAHLIQQKWNVGITAKYRMASFGNNTVSESEYLLFEPDEISEAFSNQVQGSSAGFGFDVGMQFLMSQAVSFGVMLKDVYAPMNWNSSVRSTTVKAKGKYIESLPPEMAVGTALRILENISLTADYHPALNTTTRSALHSGMEIRFLKLLSLRGGMQQVFATDAAAKYTMGMGIDYAVDTYFRIFVDYTYMSEFLANTQRLSVGMEF